MQNSISIIGLGYVGLTLGITLAKEGFNVSGFENNKERYKYIKKGKSYFHEKNIDNTLSKVIKSKKLRVYNTLDNIENSKIFIITIGTPLDNSNKVNFNNLFNICKNLKKKIKNNSIVVIRSTVKIGITRKIQSIFNSDKKKIHLAMCPERTVEGDALKELYNLPQIIGTNSTYAKKVLKKIFSKITKKIIFFNSFEEAELLKLVDNSYRDTMFGFANELAKIGEYLNINSFNVIKNVGINYPRSKIAFPGTVGGPCLTKDSHILFQSVKKKIDIPIIRSARETNEKFPLDLIKKIKIKFNKNKIKILVLGLGFKGTPETSDIRGSMAKPIINKLFSLFKVKKIYTVDNLIYREDVINFGNRILNSQKFENVKGRFDLIIITNNNKYWKKIGLEKIENKLLKKGLIFDFWNSFSNEKSSKYFSIGTGKLINNS